jgi:hypothetical protein
MPSRARIYLDRQEDGGRVVSFKATPYVEPTPLMALRAATAHIEQRWTTAFAPALERGGRLRIEIEAA